MQIIMANYLKQDATKVWRIPSNRIDIVFSDMMLNEVKNIFRPITETFRVLRKRGQFIFAVTHPD